MTVDQKLVNNIKSSLIIQIEKRSLKGQKVNLSSQDSNVVDGSASDRIFGGVSAILTRVVFFLIF